jgi:hypothetical protein
MTSGNRWAVAFGLMTAAIACTELRAAAPASPSKPVGASSSASTAKPAASPVAPAIGTLLTEYQTAMKEKNGEGLRTKCDYFVEHKPSDGVNAEAILAELVKPQSDDARADAYIKWQLLSGLPAKFSNTDALKSKALQAYRAAPPLPNHPGADHAGMQKALDRMGAKNPDLETKINEEMIAAIEKYKAQIVPFVNYRNEFASRFDPSYDVFQAYFFDIYTRVSHGTSGDEFWKKLNPTIRQWAIKGDATPQQMRALSGDLGQLYKLVSDGKYKPYYRVIWEKDRMYGGGGGRYQPPATGNGNTPTPPRAPTPPRNNTAKPAVESGYLKWQGDGVIGDLKLMTEIGDWLMERAKSTEAINNPTKPTGPQPGDRFK